jgi:hypothetical protein
MTPEEKDEKLKELEDKLDEIAQKLEDADNEGNDELVEISEEYIEVSTINPVKKQVVHFISIDETQSFGGDCSNIEDSKDAEKAFKEASEYRESGDKRPFEHGNILVLECQGEKQSASESESSSTPVPDGCYYIGICSVIQNLHQEADPFSLLESQEDDGDTVKNFMAWHTCGSKVCTPEVDEDGEPIPVSVKLDEIVLPSSGAESTTSSFVTSVSISSPTLTDKLFTQITGVVQSSEVDENDNELHKQFLALGTTNSDGSDILGAAFDDIGNFIGYRTRLDKINVNKKPEGSALSLSLVKESHQTITLDLANHTKTPIKSKEITLSANECGELTRSPEQDIDSDTDITTTKSVFTEGSANGNVAFTNVTFEEVDADDSSSSNPDQIDLGIRELEIVSDEDFTATGQIFLPAPSTTNTIEASETIDVITQMSLSMTETECDENGCKEIVVSATSTKNRLSFSSGLLISKEAASPTTQELGRFAASCDCQICPSDGYPSQFTYTVEVTQSAEQLQRATDQANDQNCITENGGTFTLTRGHEIDSFGTSIPEEEQCLYYKSPSLDASTVDACDILIQYKFVKIRPDQGFDWAGNIGAHTHPFSGTYQDGAGEDVTYNLLVPGGKIETHFSGTTFSSVKRLSW